MYHVIKDDLEIFFRKDTIERSHDETDGSVRLYPVFVDTEEDNTHLFPVLVVSTTFFWHIHESVEKTIFSKIIGCHDFSDNNNFCGLYFGIGCAFLLKKNTFLRIVDVSFSQKITFKWFSLCPACRRRFFFWKIAHFHNFGHYNFPKSVFLVKNLIFRVINCRKNVIFWHIIGPLPLDPS